MYYGVVRLPDSALSGVPDDIVNAGRAWIAGGEYDLASWQAHAQL